MKECKKCGSEDVAKVGEIYIKEVEYDCPDCGTGFLIQEDRIRDKLYTQKEVDQIKQEERKKTLEEVKEVLKDRLEDLQTEEFEGEEEDYFVRKVEVQDLIDTELSKITKRGK